MVKSASELVARAEGNGPFELGKWRLTGLLIKQMQVTVITVAHPWPYRHTKNKLGRAGVSAGRSSHG